MLNALTELHEWLFFHHRAKAIECTTTEGEGEIFLGFFFWRLKKKSPTLATVLFINALSYSLLFFVKCFGAQRRAAKENTKAQEAVTECQDQL